MFSSSRVTRSRSITGSKLSVRSSNPSSLPFLAELPHRADPAHRGKSRFPVRRSAGLAGRAPGQRDLPARRGRRDRRRQVLGHTVEHPASGLGLHGARERSFPRAGQQSRQRPMSSSSTGRRSGRSTRPRRDSGASMSARRACAVDRAAPAGGRDLRPHPRRLRRRPDRLRRPGSTTSRTSMRATSTPLNARPSSSTWPLLPSPRQPEGARFSAGRIEPRHVRRDPGSDFMTASTTTPEKEVRQDDLPAASERATLAAVGADPGQQPGT